MELYDIVSFKWNIQNSAKELVNSISLLHLSLVNSVAHLFSQLLASSNGGSLRPPHNHSEKHLVTFKVQITSKNNISVHCT